MRCTTRVTGRRFVPWVVLVGVLAAGCSGPSRTPAGKAIDPAVALFVSGQYPQAIERLQQLAASTRSEEELREIYYYLGRSYLAMGRADQAIDAFSAGVAYGDRGACVEYLEQLQAYVGTREGSMLRSEDVTRRQLAAGLLRRVIGESGGEGTTSFDDPDAALRVVVERGWMRALPDGQLHGDAAVTRAALYVVMSRVVADLGLDARSLDEYRTTFTERGSERVTGPEVMSLLDTIAGMRKGHGG